VQIVEDLSVSTALDDIRFAAVRVGYWLGWASIAVVVTGLAVDAGTRHRWLLLGATLGAAAGNTLVTVIPWREWLADRRGRLLVDVWCGCLIAFVALLVSSASSAFTLLLFLVVPFIAVVQAGRRRIAWLAISAGTCIALAALVPLSDSATVIRLMLLAVAASVALVLARTISIERTLAREANHRIKNDLQRAADFLLLARPDGPAGDVFDETAGRIHSIAAVHRLLSESGDRVDSAQLLRSIVADAPVEVEAESIELDSATAQQLGIVANELVTNALRHGAPPVTLRLEGGTETHLRVQDGGVGVRAEAPGLGLSLVRRMVEQGLGGHFQLASGPGDVGTSAEAVFPRRSR
jgi:two-component sensor histidine kinase